MLEYIHVNKQLLFDVLKEINYDMVWTGEKTCFVYHAQKHALSTTPKNIRVRIKNILIVKIFTAYCISMKVINDI